MRVLRSQQLATNELLHPSYDCAIVDRMVSDRFLPKEPYRQDFVTPFYGNARPFLEILRSVERNPDRLWACIWQWPGFLQDRAGEALRFLESERNASTRPNHKRTRPDAS